MANTELDIDDLCDTITESMSADDRQTRWQYQAACAALSTLRSECERLRARVAELDQEKKLTWSKSHEHWRQVAETRLKQLIGRDKRIAELEQAHAEQVAEREHLEEGARLCMLAWPLLDAPIFEDERDALALFFDAERARQAKGEKP